MSKEQINEMKKFMQIAEGDREDFKKALKNPLAKATKLMQQVVDGLGREWEELMNGGDEEDKEFADTIDGDMGDWRKLVALLDQNKGKQAAKMYDRLDTVSREYIYDHLESDEIEYMQKVFGGLGSMWLYQDEDYFEEDSGLDLATRSVERKRDNSPGYDPRTRFDTGETCERCGREGCECGPDCDCEPVDEAEGDKCIRCRKGTMEEGETMMGKAERCNRCGYQRDLREGTEEEGMGHYNVTVAVDDNYPNDIEVDLPYPEAVQAAGQLAKQFQKGRWEMKKYKMQDAVEWQIKWDSRDDEHLTVIRVEPSDEADWLGSPFESVELGSIAESILKEDGYGDPYSGRPIPELDDELYNGDEEEGTEDWDECPNCGDLTCTDDTCGEDEELGLRFD